MNVKKAASLIPAALLAALASACSPHPSQDEEIAAVNDESCKLENIAAIKDKGMQNRFADLCVRRNTFKPSPKRVW